METTAQDAALLSPSGVRSAAPAGATVARGRLFAAWLRGWLRRAAPGMHQQQQQQRPPMPCEPGQEPTVMACAAAMLADVAAVARGPESQAFRIACWLAVANQASASTAVINYAPEVLSSSLGVSAAGDATLFSLVISAAKVLGVVAAAAAVDRLGRRPLLLWGGTGCGAALLAAGVALVARSVPGFLSCLALFILAFSSSWAGLFWWVTSAAAAAAIKCAAHAHTYMHTHAGPYALGLHAVARSIQIS